jgi:hypothetical protein
MQLHPRRQSMRLRLFTLLGIVTVTLVFMTIFVSLSLPSGVHRSFAASLTGNRANSLLRQERIDSNPILITQNGFVPAILTTTVNMPVTWLNNSGATHILRSGAPQRLYLPQVARGENPLSAASVDGEATVRAFQLTTSDLFTENLLPGAAFTYTFAISGTYPFYLEDAPYFTGIVLVVPATSTLPPNPEDVAPSLDQSGHTNLLNATSFLFSGNNPIQTGVISGTMNAHRVAVLRGKVMDRNNAALSGVGISVLGHPEFGQTLTRAGGLFDMAVNGGGQLTIRYEKDGFLAAQRSIRTPWRDYAWLPDVVLIPLDGAVTPINLNSATMQIARGSAVSDEDGARRATILFPPNTAAHMVLSNGITVPLTTLNVRATEYTIGDSGPKAMPAELPPSSGYTYAAEFSLDEAIAAGAADVRFDKALPVYVENFLDFPVGGAVPSGYYDLKKGEWVASANGRVIKLLSVTGGQADLDINGDGVAANASALTALGVTNEERARLAQLYTPGQTLWRVPVIHFSPWDFNFPYTAPKGAIPPPRGNRDRSKFKPWWTARPSAMPMTGWVVAFAAPTTLAPPSTSTPIPVVTLSPRCAARQGSSLRSITIRRVC